jgi:hypothetical protein
MDALPMGRHLRKGRAWFLTGLLLTGLLIGLVLASQLPGVQAAPAGQSATAWSAWGALATSTATGTATATRVAQTGIWLQRLAANKPSIWGSSGLYVGLSIMYLVFFGLFLIVVTRIGNR